MKETSMSFEYPIIDTYYGRKAYGTQVCDFEERINVERMRNYRLKRTKDQLIKNNLGAILSFNEWNMRYITGTWVPSWTTPSSGLRYALLPVTAKNAILYEQGDIGYHTKNIAPWLEKVKVAMTGFGNIGVVMGPNYNIVQRNKLIQQIVDDLKAYGVDKETLALDVWDPTVVAAFEKAGIKVSPIGSLMMLQARKIKNQDEIECLRACCAIGEKMFDACKQAIRPGIKENELMGIAHKVAYDEGAEVYAGMLVTSGGFGWPNSRYATDRMVRPGETVYIDIYNTAFLGYKICYYRTFSCGPATQEAKDDYAEALGWLYDAINIIKPGVTTKELVEKWPPGPSVWGDILTKYEDQTAANNWGHGIGLALYEYPIVWRPASLEDPLTLEPGMTFAIETQHGRPGKHGVRIEEMVAVTETGFEMLSKYPVAGITECLF